MTGPGRAGSGWEAPSTPEAGGGEKRGGDPGGVRSGPKAYRGRGPRALSGAEPRCPGRPRPTTGETWRDPRTALTGTASAERGPGPAWNGGGAGRTPHSRPAPLSAASAPSPSPRKQTTRGAGGETGRERLLSFHWLRELSVCPAPPLARQPALSIGRRHVTPLHRPPARIRRARPPPSPLRAVCKGKTAVKRAAGRSQ